MQKHIPRSKTYELDVGRRQVVEMMRGKGEDGKAAMQGAFQKQMRTKKARDQAFFL